MNINALIVNDIKKHETNLNYYQIQKLHKNILNKIQFHLNSKYKSLIFDKQFNWDNFLPEIKLIIYQYKLYKNYDKYYDEVFRIIEKKFLKYITNYSENYYNGLLYDKYLKTVLNQHPNDYEIDDAHYKGVGKVTLRNIIKNEKQLKPDKYKLKKPKIRFLSKNQIMNDYDLKLKISNNI